MLELDECLEALQEENARDVNVIDLEGKWDGADYMIFITALSPRHMRRMADMFVQAVRSLNMFLDSTRDRPIYSGFFCAAEGPQSA